VTHQTIISRELLAERLSDPDWLVLDARFTLDDDSWGRRAYEVAHIPGALYANLATDLAGEIVPHKTGRRPLPSFAAWRATLSRWGVTPRTQLVVYDAAGGMMAAARVWWMLRWAGHDAVAVLDGGLQGWIGSKGRLDTTVAERSASKFEGHERIELTADVALVGERRLDPNWAVFDSRSEEGFHGRGVYHDPVRGHIPGARLADRALTLNADGSFRSPEALRAHFAELFGDVPAEKVVFYCGSGVTAAQNLLALAYAGLGDARHYVGSWSEWILDPARPVAL
jgi:thiosulfate/3-mercaptopyruvate sulfurtransferase